MRKSLTEEFIREKYSFTLKRKEELKVINIWGNELEDISVISKFPNLVTLSLSCNYISDISPIKNCLFLKELYLRNNKIDDLNQLLFLKDLNKLTILWLNNNPVTKIENYRCFVETYLPQIKILDKVPTINYFCEFLNDNDRQLISNIFNKTNNFEKEERHYSNMKIILVKDDERKLIKNFQDSKGKKYTHRRSISNTEIRNFDQVKNLKVNKCINEFNNDERIKQLNTNYKTKLFKKEYSRKNCIDEETNNCDDYLNENSSVEDEEKSTIKNNLNFMHFDYKSCKNLFKLSS